MVKKRSAIDQMRENPRGNWQISDIERLCKQIGLVIEPPSRGSHFKVYSIHVRDPLTIPAHRPVKPPYIRLLVDLAERHLAAHGQKDEKNG